MSDHMLSCRRLREKFSKQKAKQLFDSGDITQTEVGTFAGLAYIHRYLFEDIYAFAGEMREVNIAKGDFRFAPLMYLRPSLRHIDAMSQNTFDEIIEKYGGVLNVLLLIIDHPGLEEVFINV